MTQSLRLAGTAFTVALLTTAIDARAQTNALPKWSAVPETAIDGVRETLSAIQAMVVDVAGNMSVVERRAASIRVYSPEGTLLRTIGRLGDGPGEFREIGGIGLTGDSLWVFDRLRHTVTLLYRDGRVIRVVGISKPKEFHIGETAFARFTTFTPTAMLPDGSILAQADNASGIRGFPDYYKRGIPILRLSPTGDPVEIIRWKLAEPDVVRVQTSQSALTFSLPFANLSSYGSVSDGGAAAEARAILTGDDAGKLELRLFRLRDTLYVRRFPVSMVPASAAAIDSGYRNWEAWGKKTLSGELYRRMMDSLKAKPRPIYLPPLANVLISRDGGALIVFAARGDEREHLVVDRNGAPLALVVLPRAVSLLQFDGSQLWGALKNGDDVPSIVRYKLSPKH